MINNPNGELMRTTKLIPAIDFQTLGHCLHTAFLFSVSPADAGGGRAARRHRLGVRLARRQRSAECPQHAAEAHQQPHTQLCKIPRPAADTLPAACWWQLVLCAYTLWSWFNTCRPAVKGLDTALAVFSTAGR